MKKRLLVFPLLLISILSAQTFVPEVNIEGQNLNAQQNRIINELKNTIEQYIFSNTFSNELYEYEVPYRIKVFIQSIRTSGATTVVTCSGFFSNSYDQRYIDNSWIFEYTEGEALYREVSYHPLRDLIDYYGYIIMGTEMDGIEDMGGNSLYNLARDIYSRGSSSKWSTGWSSRKDDFDLLVNDFRLRKARFLVNHAFWDIDEGNGTGAWYSLDEALDFLAESQRLDPKNKHLGFYIESHYKDAEYFTKVYQDTSFLPKYRRISRKHQDYFSGVASDFKIEE